MITLDFNPQRKDVFLVGTDDGKIYKGSVNDPGMIDMTFHAHDFTIYAVQWRYFDTFHLDIFYALHSFSSPFHSNIFASCSADGTVKIWHEKLPFVLRSIEIY